MIELKTLTVGYGNSPVLRDVNLTFPRGQVTVLLGPNGCGKSTLLKSIPGLSRILEGSILVDGRDVGTFSPQELARLVSYLPQTRRVPDMTVEQLVLHGRFPYLSYPRRYRREDHAIVREVLDQLGLCQYVQTPLNRLSGGIRQKASIAMALAQDTDAVLLDEPNAFLDIAHQLQLMELCAGLARRDKAVVLVLHDLNLAMTCSDRLAVLSEGSVIARGDPESVYESGGLDRAFGVEVLRTRTGQGWQYHCRLNGKEI